MLRRDTFGSSEKLVGIRHLSADDTNFLPAGKKVLRHCVSGVAACSKNNVHINLHSEIVCSAISLGYTGTGSGLAMCWGVAPGLESRRPDDQDQRRRAGRPPHVNT